MMTRLSPWGGGKEFGKGMDGGQCRSVNTLYPNNYYTTQLHTSSHPTRTCNLFFSSSASIFFWHYAFEFLFLFFSWLALSTVGKRKKKKKLTVRVEDLSTQPGIICCCPVCVCVYVARTVKEIASRSSEQFFRREFSSSALSLSAGKTRNDGRAERRVIRKEKEIKKGKEDASVHFPLSVKRSQVLPICTTTTVYLPPTSGNTQFILLANEAAQQQRLLYTYM